MFLFRNEAEEISTRLQVQLVDLVQFNRYPQEIGLTTKTKISSRACKLLGIASYKLASRSAANSTPRGIDSAETFVSSAKSR